MQIGLIIDVERAIHEHGMLSRLVSGFQEQGDRLVFLVPDALPDEYRPARDLIDEQLVHTYPVSRTPWSRKAAITRIATLLEREPPDVLYVVGRESWSFAHDLAARMDIPVALDIWCARLVRAIPNTRASAHIAALIVPNEPLGAAVTDRHSRELVSIVPFGVEAPEEPVQVFDDPERAVGLAVVGSGVDVQSYTALIEALAELADEFPSAQVVLELRGAKAHDVWRHAMRLDLLDHVSAVGDAAGVRELLTRCDALIHPERLGTLDTLLLEAMAAGLPVVVGADPLLAIVEDGEHGIVIGEALASAWMNGLRRLLSDPAAARDMGMRGRRTVTEQHSPETQLARLRETLDRIVSGGAISFQSAR